jgi:hypothetical protein
MIRKLETAALSFRAPLRAKSTSKYAPTDEREHLELALEIVVEQQLLAPTRAWRRVTPK